MTPFRITIQTDCIVSLETLQTQAALHQHYRKVEPAAPHGRKLAVVGAGPLVVNDLDELRTWDGDIWAINSAARWLSSNGVKCTLVSIDPLDMPGEFPCADALIATCCHPALFAKLEGRDIRTFDLAETHADGLAGGCTTALRMAGLAFHLGYLDVNFFGCEGSYEGESDHVDYHNGEAQELIVRAGGKDYRIEAGLLVQCQDFAQLFATFPQVFHNRSHGLLRAMMEHPDTWEVVGVSRAMKEHLEQVNGRHGLYEQPYVPLQATG